MQIALYILLSISVFLTLILVCLLTKAKNEPESQFNFRQYFIYEAFGGDYGTIKRGLFYIIIFLDSLSSIIMAFSLQIDESITSRGYYILFAGFHLVTEVFLVLLSVLSFKQERMRIVSFVLFGCFLTISNGSAAIILMSIANRLGGYRETMPLILAGVCILFAISSFVPLLNPKLSNYAKLVPITEKDGTSHLERPKYFAMAVSEWILFFVMEVSLAAEIVFFMATCN